MLYVEDNDANFALASRVLRSRNYELNRAIDVPSAMREIEVERGALVLLDLDLPGVSGLQFARYLKSSPRLSDIPIVIVTASVMKRERMQAQEVGAEYFVEKPFDIMKFRAIVDKAYQQHLDNKG